MTWRAVTVLLLATAPFAADGDEIFERDLSTPFLRGEDDRFLRDGDLPGPLRKTWPYADAPARPFPAVEARRACHARALFEIGERGGRDAEAVARLESARAGALSHVVKGRYTAAFENGRREVNVTCEVTSQEVVKFSLSE